MTIRKVQTGLRLEECILYKAHYIARREKRSLNAQLEYAVQKCVEDYEAVNGPIPFDESEAWASPHKQ